ncbi:MAG TPA: hypothetical protein VK597_01860 [Inquilinus sp.]|nr:hypothetical protein [Inquilinus sp.]
MTETPDLLRRWLSNAHPIGPAVRADWALADLFARQISPADAPLILLGASAPSLAQLMIRNGVPPGNVALVEAGSELAASVQATHPAARLLWTSAVALATEDPFAGEKAGAVASVLPLRFLPVRKITLVLNAAFGHLRPGGALYQVTSGQHCPVPDDLLRQLGLVSAMVDAVETDGTIFTLYRLARGVDRC